MQITTSIIRAEETWPLRHKVLRPHQTLKDCEYPDDHKTSAIHIGAWIDEKLVGVASAFWESPEKSSENEAYRLRGMAVLPEMQSKGIGSLILKKIQDEVRFRKGTMIWCNARTSASHFYAAHGFERKGNEYDLPGLGPHYFLEVDCKIVPRNQSNRSS